MQFAIGIGKWPEVDVSHHEPQFQGLRREPETVPMFRGDSLLFPLLIWNEEAIAGEQDIRVLTQLHQLGILRMVPNDAIVLEAILSRNPRDVFPLLDRMNSR